MSQPTVPIGVAGPAPSVVGFDRACNTCGYSLRGLPVNGACPECGTPVAFSLRGFLLRHADPAYVERLQRGLRLILWAIVANALTVVGSMAAIVAVAAFGIGRRPAELLLGAAAVGVSVAFFLGYWWFTEPDLGYTGVEQPHSARRVLRVAATVSIGFSLALVAADFVAPAGPGPSGWAPGVLLVALRVVGLAAWAVQFFAAMRHVRWVAGRIPDPAIAQRAGLYTWLLPVIAVVGFPMFFVGPLIALVLYWSLLDWLRKNIGLGGPRRSGFGFAPAG